MRVLVADDEMNVRSALKLLLEQEPGISVTAEVTNYTELASQVKNTNPDLILLAWELPGELGREFLNTIHRDYSGTRVVVLSSQPDVRKRALTGGATAFISKEEPPGALISVIRRLNTPNKAQK
jgi:DNA-binding NarL/FixJ family response regulator